MNALPILASAKGGSVPILSLLIWIPIVGALVVMLLPSRRPDVARALATVLSVTVFGLACYLLVIFDPESGALQLRESADWIPSLGIGYRLGVDGFSLFMLALTAFLFPLMLIGSTHVTKRVKHYVAFLLLLEGVQMGVFAATDTFLFFVFWELTLIPVYFLIGYWGGEDRRRAATKFFLYTAAGSAFLLAAVVGAGALADGGVSFDYGALARTDYPMLAQQLLFWGFTIGFLFKVPVVPFHTWLPDAHTQAPTAGSADLAGVLLKLGAFGMLRYSIPLFPRAAVQAVPVLLTLAVIGIVFTALVAIRQRDAKRLIAYTSVSHLGFVVMGIFALTTTGVIGGVTLMLNHGITTAALFFLIGFFYDRRHTHAISAFGGLKKTMPVYAAIFLFMTFAAAGLPGLNGFVGEMLTLFGTFVVHRWWAVVAGVSVILAGIYMLWLYQRLFYGSEIKEENKGLKDLGAREIAVMVPMIVLVLLLGIYPKPVLDRIEPTAQRMIARVEVATRGTPQEYVQPAVTDEKRNEKRLRRLEEKGEIIAARREAEAAREEKEKEKAASSVAEAPAPDAESEGGQ